MRRGYVPAFRTGTRKLNIKFIHGLKILEGQSYSVDEARTLNLEPGGRSMYGLVKKFIRVCCTHLHYRDFAILSLLLAPAGLSG